MPKITYTNINATKQGNFAVANQYQDTIPNPAVPPEPPTIPNPETKLQFMERKGRDYFEAQIAYGKKLGRQAQRQAEDTADDIASNLPPGDVDET